MILLHVGVIVSDLLFPLKGVGDCCALISLPVAVRRAKEGEGDEEEDCWTLLLLLLLHVASLFEYLLLMFLWT